MTDLRTRDEVAPSPRARRGAHRAAPSRLAALLPVVVVAAVVGVAVLALVLFTGLGGGSAGGGTTASAPAAAPTTGSDPLPEVSGPSATPTEPSAGTGGADGSQSASPEGQASGGEPSAPSSTGVDEQGGDDAAPPPSGAAGDGDATGAAPVVVLNATRTSGLAARTAEGLEGEGWTVSRTGDAPAGSVETTTVRYSDPSLESAAQAVAASLGGAAVESDPDVDAGVVTVVAGPELADR